MADSLTSIGSTALVTGIVQALAKSISKLHELHARWKQADFIFINLIAQLSALKAALTKLEEWMDTNVEEERDLHHQLIMDFEAIITCCRMLAHKIDTEISELYLNADNTLRYESKVKLVLKNGTLEELQKMVDRQTNALTTLLTACNFKVISNQKNLLERSTTRKMIQQVKDDTSSLYVQRGSISLHSKATRYTDTLSKISRSFEFDRELFTSKVYEKALRLSLKDTVDALRRQASPTLTMRNLRTSAKSLEPGNSQSLDRKLEKELARPKPACRAVVLGDSDHARIFLNETKIRHGNGFTAEELREHKTIIRTNIWDIIRTVQAVLTESFIDMECCDTTKDLAVQLGQKLKDGRSAADTNISCTTAKALKEVWASELFKKVIQSAPHIPTSAEYFVKEIDRISSVDYIPTPEDILNASDKRKGIREYAFTRGISMNMIDLSSQRWSEKEQWIHHLHGATSIMFFIDLSSYTEIGLEDLTQNRLRETIDLYIKVADSPWCRESSFILLLFNSPAFQKKLQSDPLSHYFLSYQGTNDANKACDYIIECFKKSTVRNDVLLYHYICSPNDYKRLHNNVFASISDTTIRARLAGRVAILPRDASVAFSFRNRSRS